MSLKVLVSWIVASWILAISSASSTFSAEEPVSLFPLFPLSTQGRFIVDINQNRFKIKAVNWWGANDALQVVAGLDQQPISMIIGLIQEWKFNAIRLPFSNQMLHDTAPVQERAIRANPQFLGMTPLQVYDQTVAALTAAGIAVILDNHSTTSEWCCNYDFNGLWHHTAWFSSTYQQTSEMWQHDWLMMVERYKENPAVIAADLRNEVRTMRWGSTYLPEIPQWGGGGDNDWRQAAQSAGNAMLKVNPNLLILVEGINWQGLVDRLGSGHRPLLQPVQELPLRLRVPNKLVYSVHQYSFTGPRNTGDSELSGNQPTYESFDTQAWRDLTEREWGYVTASEQYYTAPVILNEFGAPPGAGERTQAWYSRMTDYLIEKDLDFAFWPLNGNDGWGLVSSDWSQTLQGDWRFPHLKRLIEAPIAAGKVHENRYTSLNISQGDDNQSPIESDWNPGSAKGTCPSGFRLVGLSQNYRALCADLFTPELLSTSMPPAVSNAVSSFVRVEKECPANHYATGFSTNFFGVNGLLCVPSKTPLSESCRDLKFNQGDNRSSAKGGDFAIRSYKGQCADDEYMKGIALQWSKVSEISCCRL